MAALTAARVQTDRLGDSAVIDLLKVPLAADTKIFAGSLVMIDAGYGKPAAAATGKLVIGRAEQTVDNTGGSAGAKVVEVRRGSFKWNNSSAGDLIAQADFLTVCYAVDDQTVAKTDGTGTRSPAGIVVAVESDGVIVESLGLNLAGFLIDTTE